MDYYGLNLTTPTIPKVGFIEARKSYELQKREEAFMNFNRCTRNRFIRERLYYRQYGICPYCGKQLPYYIQGVCVHHINYLRCCCIPNEKIKVNIPHNGNRCSETVPNCEWCFFRFPNEAAECLKRLVLLHTECHKMLHAQGRDNI